MHIVIIGNGIAGVSCARYVRKLSSHKITIISGETPHFFSRTALMYVYMGHMKMEDTKPYEDHFWRKNRIDLKLDWVVTIDSKLKRLDLKSGESVPYDRLVLACGSQPRKLGIPGESLHGVRGLYSFQDLEKLINFTPKIKSAAVVGGGLIGIELAEMFQSRNIPVHFLIRESSFWQHQVPPPESDMITSHIKSHGVQLHLDTTLKAIQGDADKEVLGIETSNGAKIDCQWVGMAVGVSPNINWLKASSIETDQGVLVDNTFRTNIPEVYAIGDAAQMRQPPDGRASIEQTWYTGKLHGATAAYHICGHQVFYNPGPWYNSAKFFDIEYQVYGQIPANLQESQSTFYWQHPLENKAIRFLWDRTTGSFLGMHSLGWRWRHTVLDEWLRASLPIEQVVHQLELASFDPEFSKSYLSSIRKSFNSQANEY